MSSSLKDKTINSMLWCSIDKVGTTTFVFVCNLVLARLLCPEEFGCIAMLHVFLAIADILIHGGFGAALIQKQDATQLDYSSIFYFNIVFSVLLYGVLFFTAPAIASFYGIPLLCKVLRIQALELIIHSLTVVQVSVLKKHLCFKSLAIRNIISSVIGSVVGIVCAFVGFGVWSLVVNALLTCMVGVVLLWKLSDWKPTAEFSWKSVVDLFKFGGLLMTASIVNTIYDNLQSLVIGRFFTASDLGYVNQAKKLETVPSSALTSVVNQVSFPVFSKIQSNNEKLCYGLKHNIRAIEYINLPMMMLLIVIAEPLIIFLYGSKWAMSIPFFQILCVSRFICPINSLNYGVIPAVGKANLYLMAQVLKCIVAIVLVFVSVGYGIYALLIALTIIPYIEFVVCSIMTKKIIGYGTINQIRDILPIALISIVVSAITYFGGLYINFHPVVVMTLQVVLFVILYIFATKLFHIPEYDLYYNEIMKKIKIKK